MEPSVEGLLIIYWNDSAPLDKMVANLNMVKKNT